jgi:hypothetical protein
MLPVHFFQNKDIKLLIEECMKLLSFLDFVIKLISYHYVAY